MSAGRDARVTDDRTDEQEIESPRGDTIAVDGLQMIWVAREPPAAATETTGDEG